MKVVVYLPPELFQASTEITGKSITDTIIEGLQRLRGQRTLAKIRAIQGKIPLNIDLDELRGRNRH